MIFGCHITPHWRVAHGVPMVCMAQTVNTAQDMLVSTKPLDGVNDLKERVLAEPELCDEEGHLTSHVRGTYELYLRDAGLSSDMLEVKTVDDGNKTQLLLDGKADVTFAPARKSEPASASGSTPVCCRAIPWSTRSRSLVWFRWSRTILHSTSA